MIGFAARPGTDVLPTCSIATNGTAEATRYVLDTQELEDENTGVNPQPLQVQLLNFKLLLSNQDQAGYEVLPIARIVKSAKAEATPELDESYIPPVLACDAWKQLGAGIMIWELSQDTMDSTSLLGAIRSQVDGTTATPTPCQ